MNQEDDESEMLSKVTLMSQFRPTDGSRDTTAVRFRNHGNLAFKNKNSICYISEFGKIFIRGVMSK